MDNSLGPLFFNTEDDVLWNTLKKLPTERCVELTIQALREFFQNHPELLPVSSDKAKALDIDHELCFEEAVMDKAESESEPLRNEGDSIPRQSEISLESLFEINPSEAKPDPVKNLLSLIGEEEDEDVLRFFQKRD